MLPTKLTAVDPETERRRYKIVRRDTLEDAAPGNLRAIDLDAKTAACWFANLSDDQMAEFLIEVSNEAQKHPGFDNQWYYLGGHLRNCECATDEGDDPLLGALDRSRRTSITPLWNAALP